MSYCTGIGSRDAPAWALTAAERIAGHLRKRYCIRHGDAKGMDTAFSKGADGNEEVWIPQKNFNYGGRHSHGHKNILSTLMYNVAGNWLVNNHVVSYFWFIKDEFTRRAFARNLYQLLGHSTGARVENDVYALNYTLSEFVVYWAPVDKRGAPKGGTGVAVKAANVLEIPTYNLGNKKEATELCTKYGIGFEYVDDTLVIVDPMSVPSTDKPIGELNYG